VGGGTGGALAGRFQSFKVEGGSNGNDSTLAAKTAAEGGAHDSCGEGNIEDFAISSGNREWSEGE
jgi:hypothetical protein